MNLLLTSIVSLGACAWVWMLGSFRTTPFWVALVVMTGLCVLQAIAMKRTRTRRDGFNLICSSGSLLLAGLLTVYVYA